MRKSKKSKPQYSSISRIDKLPLDLKNSIFDNNYRKIFELAKSYLIDSLKIYQVGYNIFEYDYSKILEKLKVKHSDVKNYNKFNDKRNFKDLNKKIQKFINKLITPIVIEYGEIMDLLEPISLFNERHHDFSYRFSKINYVEQIMRKSINNLNKLLYKLKNQYNSTLLKNETDFLNSAIKKLNKIIKKPLPLIYYENSLTSQRFVNSNKTPRKKISLNSSKKYSKNNSGIRHSL